LAPMISGRQNTSCSTFTEFLYLNCCCCCCCYYYYYYYYYWCCYCQHHHHLNLAPKILMYDFNGTMVTICLSLDGNC
jgi:hypothetical protein